MDVNKTDKTARCHVPLDGMNEHKLVDHSKCNLFCSIFFRMNFHDGWMDTVTLLFSLILCLIIYLLKYVKHTHSQEHIQWKLVKNIS